jgi:hypothetical protein
MAAATVLRAPSHPTTTSQPISEWRPPGPVTVTTAPAGPALTRWTVCPNRTWPPPATR